ncbi:MAG: hypothetical protein D6797_05670 [Bdellovibrio sp.]|nr:MAG: hypothetical protein D6797_05670 [Bdellovibrio sp.]
MRALFSFLKTFLKVLLAFQLGCGIAWAQNAYTQKWLRLSEKPQQWASRLGRSLFFMSSQSHRVLYANYQKSREYNLSQPDVHNAYVGVAKVSDLEFLTSSDRTSLIIRMKEKNKVHEHVISGFGEITAPPVFRDAGNFVVFANRENGVFVIPVRLAKTVLFKAPVPVLNILPPPPMGGVITSFDIFDFNGPREQVRFLDGLEDSELVFAGDLGITVEFDHQPTTHMHLYRRDLSLAVSMQLQYFSLFADILNRNEEPELVTIQLLSKHMKSYLSYLEQYGELIKKGIGDREELVQEALAQFVRRDGGQLLKELLAEVPQNAFERLAYAPRDGMTVQRLKEKFQKLEKGKYEEEKSSLKLLEERVQSYFERPTFLRKVAYLMVGARQALSLKNPLVLGGAAGVTLGAYLSRYETITEKAYQVFFQMMDLYAHSPLSHAFDKVQQAVAHWGQVFQDTYSFTMWASMLGGLILLQRSAIWASSLLSYEEAKNMSAVQKFFTIGMRMMARANNVLTVFWEKLLRQKLLYGVVDHQMSPFSRRSVRDLRPIGFHKPWASEKEVERLSQQANLKIKSDIQARSLASYLTALVIVAYEQEGKGQPVDVVTLSLLDRLEEQIKQFKEEGLVDRSVDFLKVLHSKDFLPLWDATFPYVYFQLQQYIKKMKHGEVIGIDKPAVKMIRERLHKILRKIDRAQSPTMGSLLRNAWFRSRLFFSKKLIPYLFVGSVWRKFSLNWRYGVAGAKDAEVAANAVLPDYTISMAIGAALYPQMYSDGMSLAVGNPWMNYDFLADIGSERLKNSVFPWQMGVEQTLYNASVGFYGAAAAEASDLFPEPSFSPRSDSWIDSALMGWKGKRTYKEKLEELNQEHFSEPVEVQVKKQNVRDALRKIKENFSLREYLEEHGRFIEKITGETVLGNLLLTAPVLGAGFLGAQYLQGGIASLGDAFSSTSLGVMQNFYILMMKYSFAGYAFLWPYIHIATRQGAGYVLENQSLLRAASYAVELGTRVDNPKIYVMGVKKLKGLFARGNVEVPEPFQKQAENFTAEEARAFLRYVLEDSPVPLKKNPWVFVGAINIGVGAIGTTILYFSLYTGALSLTTLAKEKGMDAAWAAFAGNTSKAMAILLGTYLLTRYSFKVFSKKNLSRMKEASLRSYVKAQIALKESTEKWTLKLKEKCRKFLVR